MRQAPVAIFSLQCGDGLFSEIEEACESPQAVCLIWLNEKIIYEVNLY